MDIRSNKYSLVYIESNIYKSDISQESKNQFIEFLRS
jgi:hypothetical protein